MINNSKEHKHIVGGQRGELTFSFESPGVVFYTYDGLNRLAQVSNDLGIHSYTYTGDGQLHKVQSLDNAESSVYSYDSIGRLIYYISQNDTNGITQNFRQSYNDSNRLKGFGYIVDIGGTKKIDQY